MAQLRASVEKKDITPFDCIGGAGSIDGPLSIVSSKTGAEDLSGAPEGHGQSVSFTVYGDPIPLSRHRTVSGGLRTYNPSANDQRKFAKACISAGVLPSQPIEGPVEAIMTFYFPRPKSHYRTGKYAGQLKDGQDVWHAKRKDLDNLVKFVLDSLNSLAYVDDGQVCSIKAMKLYTNVEDHPRTEIIFKTLTSCTSNELQSKEAETEDQAPEPLLKSKSTNKGEGEVTSKQLRKVSVKEKETFNAQVREVGGELRGHADIFACSS